MTPETRVLTADLYWVPAGSVAVGDALLGVDEEMPLPAHRRWRVSVVEEVSEFVKPCCRLKLDDGTTVVCAKDQEFLAARKPRRWRQAWELRAGERITQLTSTRDSAFSREGGYLAAAFDGEGCLRQNPVKLRGTDVQGTMFQLGFTQKNNAMLAETRRCLEVLGFPYSDINHDGDRNQRRVSISERAEVLRFLGQIRPVRLLAKFDADGVGAAHPVRLPRVIAKEGVEPLLVIALKTSTQTFVADGRAVHCGHDYAFDPAWAGRWPPITGRRRQQEAREVSGQLPLGA